MVVSSAVHTPCHVLRKSPSLSLSLSLLPRLVSLYICQPEDTKGGGGHFELAPASDSSNSGFFFFLVC